ncbi:L,D-transpeptidase family protein [Streptacidiphilus sp. EB129]|uniref:L,D-transpeptidase family protein n=1 Tax=Streptacidiphilus sp. EB129 TaxID=3156262 RepID=UPI003513ECF9
MSSHVRSAHPDGAASGSDGYGGYAPGDGGYGTGSGDGYAYGQPYQQSLDREYEPYGQYDPYGQYQEPQGFAEQGFAGQEFAGQRFAEQGFPEQRFAGQEFAGQGFQEPHGYQHFPTEQQYPHYEQYPSQESPAQYGYPAPAEAEPFGSQPYQPGAFEQHSYDQQSFGSPPFEPSPFEAEPSGSRPFEPRSLERDTFEPGPSGPSGPSGPTSFESASFEPESEQSFEPAAAPVALGSTAATALAPAAAPRGSRPMGRGSSGPSRAQARVAARQQSKKKRRLRTGFLGVGSVAAVAVIAVAGLVHPEAAKSSTAQAGAAPAPDATRSAPADTSRSTTRETPATALAQLPGVGPSFLKQIPANTDQVLLVTGTAKDANTGTAVLYTRTADGSWLPGTAWASHNAKDGWTTDHQEGDLHSPIGVFSLTDAGGLDANPGTKLPYLHSSAFQALGTGFEGESLADAFDYVVAINYNHVPGTSPLSPDRPMGASKGGGIWVHVDHGGPTHGCVSLSKADMAELLRDLDPSKHPVIVMGDAASLKS